jgi:septum formation protein
MTAPRPSRTSTTPSTARLREQPLTPRRLVLASRSPQRRAILEQLGIPFEVRPADIDESESGPPHRVALGNAGRKAEAVSRAAEEGELVLGVDTVVALGARLYGKPSDSAEARETLQALSARTHAVIGGLCLMGPTGTRTAVATTEVEFRTLERPMIDWYLNTGEWRDRAGAYAIQGKGSALVKRIEGDYLNVVGLPLAALLELEPALIGS